jgi:hypothetical protein
MFSKRVPMERGNPSPESLVTVFINVYWSPRKRRLLHNGEKHKVTVHGVPQGQKAYIQWGAALFPKGIINDTAITTPLRQNHDNLANRPCNHTLYDIPLIRFVFQVIQKDLRSSLMMTGYS